MRVATDALVDAGITTAADVDEIVLGHYNAGFSPQDFTASLVLQADPALRFKPTTRVENACATGSAAVHQGVKAIKAGDAKIVLVVGVEQMTRRLPPRSARRCSKPPTCRRTATPRAASPAYSARSPAPISSAMATSPTPSR